MFDLDTLTRLNLRAVQRAQPKLYRHRGRIQPGDLGHIPFTATVDTAGLHRLGGFRVGSGFGALSADQALRRMKPGCWYGFTWGTFEAILAEYAEVDPRGSRYAQLQPCGFIPAGRMGSVRATREQLEQLFGTPTVDTPSRDGKVTFTYQFITPRGPAEVRDYWWNPAGELSLAATNAKAALWLAKHLRALGIPAARRLRIA